MLPKYIKVKNFTSYLQETINFDLYSPIFCVTGLNGTGKSSIIDMITTAIFYRARGVNEKGTGMDSLINKNENQFEIEFVFTMNNNEYKIIRRKIRNGSHELEFFINGISQTEKLTETQNKISNIIKMDYETFLDTVCIGQGQSGRFMQKKPNERKDVFIQVLGLDKYEKLEQYTKELKKETKLEIDKLKDKINNLDSINNNENYYEDIKNNNKMKIVNCKTLIINQEKELENVLIEKAQYEQAKKSSEHILNQRVTLKSKLANITQLLNSDIIKKDNLEAKLIQYQDIDKQITEYQKIIEENQQLYAESLSSKSSLETNIDMLKTQAKQMKNKYDRLHNYNEGQCEFCGHNITPQYKTAYLNDLRKSAMELITQCKSYEPQLEEMNKNISLYKKLMLENKQKLQTAQNIYTQVIKAKEQIEHLKNTILNLNEQIVEIQNEYNENISINIDNIKTKIFNDNILKNQINNLRNELSILESDYAIATNKLAEIKLSKKEIEKINVKLNDLQILYDDYDDLITAWGKSGIQAAIIRNTLPEIEVEINNLLQLLCNGKVTVEFNTEKVTKGKKKVSKKPTSIETLDIIVNDQGESRTYETYSGGEQFRIDFACHVGLSKFLAKRAGAVIDFFIVDEGLGSQDHSAKDNFCITVTRLSTIFKKIMVITHIPEIQEQFDTKIEVSKDPINGSQVKLVGI